MGKKAQRQHGRRLQELQAEIEDVEAWLEKINYELQDAEAAQDDAWLAQLQDESVVIRAQLMTLTAEWDQLTS